MLLNCAGRRPWYGFRPTSRRVILRYLDTGAIGVHVPLVNSAEEAEAAVAAVHCAPRGTRGLAGVRASDYGTVPLAEGAFEQANEATMVVIQVETRAAVERVGGASLPSRASM